MSNSPAHSLPPTTKYLLLILLILIGMLFNALFRFGLEWAYDINAAEIFQTLNKNSTISQRYFVRWVLLISQMMSFLLPVVLTAIILYRRKWAHSLDLHRWPKLYNLLLGSFMILVAFPVAYFFLWLNQQIPIPEWAASIENSTARLLDGLIVVDSPLELISNILVIALLPAVGEELLFRGIIQKGISSSLHKPIAAIWLAAFLFSAFHLQLEGFLPRLFLGALLGYLYYWTGNLWICIAAHFTNNAVQIVAQYTFSKEFAEAQTSNSGEISWSVTIISLIFVLILSKMMISYNRNNQRS